MAGTPLRAGLAPAEQAALRLRRGRAAWLALPGNVRGALWIALSCLFFATSGAIVKVLGQRLDSFEIAFFRSAFGLLVVLPFVARAGLGVLATDRLGLHFVRAVLGVAGMTSGFYAVTHLRLADAAALGFTTPLFLIVLAALVLREMVGARRWSATALGFLGVLIMVRPGVGAIEFAALVAIFGAFCAAVVKLFIKRVAASEDPLTMLVYLGLFATLLTAVPTAFVWRTPTGPEFALLLLLGAVGMLAQVCMIRGYRIGEASAMAPFEYSRLPFAAVFGYLLFMELPDGYSLFGAAIIAGSTLYIARREARLGKRAPPPDGAGG